MVVQRKMSSFLACAVLVVLTSVILSACGSDSNSTPPVQQPAVTEPTVSVKDTAGVAVEGATVYAIPASDVADLAAQPLTLVAGNYTAEALNVDEPLEDLVNGNYTPAGGGLATYISAVTDAAGKAVLTGLAVDTTEYFIYVAPVTADHLPGGSLCRNAVTGASLDNTVTAIEVSTTPSATATYIGSSECLVCHVDYADQKKTAHKHGIMVPGAPSALQDLSEFGTTAGVYNYMAGIEKFEVVGGTTVWFYDYDSNRGFDKFKTSESDPTAVMTDAIYATVRAFKDVDGKYKMEFTNLINPSDPNSPLVREAMLNYGGGVYKQRYLTSFSPSESLHMLPLQFNASGDEANGDRTRKVWRDYHLDWWLPVVVADPTTSVFNLIPAAGKSFDLNCASCHFTGFSIAKNATTGDYTASAVEDANGEIHPLTGVQQELNVGCETCHGPGSEHQDAFGLGKFIVTPGNLTAERESVICGQCHSRPKGTYDGITGNDSPLNADGKMLFPGTSRADYLAGQTSRNDATTSDLWADQHSKSHHQQYTDFIASAKYRNGSALKTCTACHDVHAPGTDRHQLSGTTDNTLCLSCHTDVVSGDHQVAKIGAALHAGAPALCIDCHSVKTAKSGAGEQDWAGGDISSHRFDVPRVATTTDAMPIPFNNSCGVCH